MDTNDDGTLINGIVELMSAKKGPIGLNSKPKMSWLPTVCDRTELCNRAIDPEGDAVEEYRRLMEEGTEEEKATN